MEQNLVLLDQKQAAQLLGVSPKTMEAWRVRGFGPKFIKVGRLCRYLESSLLDFVHDQERRSTSETETAT